METFLLLLAVYVLSAIGARWVMLRAGSYQYSADKEWHLLFSWFVPFVNTCNFFIVGISYAVSLIVAKCDREYRFRHWFFGEGKN